MGHRAAMRGRRRRRCRGGLGATAVVVSEWFVVGWDESGSGCECSRATTAIVVGVRKRVCRTVQGQQYSTAGQCGAAQDGTEVDIGRLVFG
jgi:hypothetical protein